jgi:hypothetical protein
MGAAVDMPLWYLKKTAIQKGERALQRDVTYADFGGVLYPELLQLGGKMQVAQANEVLNSIQLSALNTATSNSLLCPSPPGAQHLQRITLHSLQVRDCLKQQQRE